MVQQSYDKLGKAELTVDEEPLAIELVFAEEKSIQEVSQAISDSLPDADFRIEYAFDEGQDDRFLFVYFENIPPEGQEPEVFAFARDLRRELGAREANPVLTDSLYGAAAIGLVGDEESFLSLCSTPVNDQLPDGWVHPIIDTPSAWADNTGEKATIAVIDTGYSSHSELEGAIRKTGQLNLIEGGTDATDRFSGGLLKQPGHGTTVCSVVASRGSADDQGNTTGPGRVTGSAPGATLLPIRAIKSVINFRQTTIPRAVEHAIREKADIIVMALGGPTRVSSTEMAFRRANEAGIVIVCAAGNCWPKVVFPAAYATSGLCTAVAALQRDLLPWRKTGSGPEVTISAPGENVWAAKKRKKSDSDTGINPSQGTTLATSLTTGAAALWVTRHGGRKKLKAKADAIGTTVQRLFSAAVVHGITKPPIWNGSGKLGAGVLNTAKLLAAPLMPGEEAPTFSPPPTAMLDSTFGVLRTHIANHNPDALADIDGEMADFAPELLWLSHRAGARQRAAESSTMETMLPPDRMSPDLADKLGTRPSLKSVTQS